MKQLIALAALSLMLTACHDTVQTTSGAEYLSRYQSVPVTPGLTLTAPDGTKIKGKSIDQLVREAAAVEPVLKFPARIGLARIDDGSLTVMPEDEGKSWNDALEKLGPDFGEFVPVNPMIAKMASEGLNAEAQNSRINDAVNLIRLGAARQHLDAVLIYEVVSKESERSNILTMANVTILGGYILPSHVYDAEGLGDAMLIDVVQGYPYGTISTTVDKKTRLSSSWGWGSDYGDSQSFSVKVKAQAARQLAGEACDLFTRLRSQLDKQRTPVK